MNHTKKERTFKRAVKKQNVIYLDIRVSVQVLLTLDQERWVIQSVVNVLNVFIMPVVLTRSILGVSFKYALL